jgi:integrase
MFKRMMPMQKSVRNVHGILAKALSVAVGAGYLKVNPADKVTLPRVEKKEIHPLTDEQVKAFLDAASQDAYGIALKVILFTGLRESEALGLTWD